MKLATVLLATLVLTACQYMPLKDRAGNVAYVVPVGGDDGFVITG